jgi:molybdopterin/thiamine biosynthesis adenylyltransferase
LHKADIHVPFANHYYSRNRFMKLDQSSNLHAYKPIILTYSSNEHTLQLEQLIQQETVEIIDTIQQQIGEWIRIQHAGKPITKELLESETERILNGIPIERFGNWVFYPWSNRLVHLLPEDAFIEVRTNRNQLKITKSEQAILQTKTVGIIGLSVGQSVALTVAMERVCGKLYLADFDTLDLSNLNRVRAGVHQLGLLKVIIAAREVAEIDPYLQVEIYNKGISSENLDTFLGDGDSKIDILVEVCDELDIKIKARIAARNKKIPVVMDTNDRGMIDIERFDLEPNRPLFHNLFDESTELSKLETNERIKVLMKLASFEYSSQRLKLSMNEIGKSISTWPQLASSVTLGGGATCDVIRRILLNQFNNSGRFYIDLDALIS